MRVPSMVLIAQAVFQLERGQTDRQTRLNALPTPALWRRPTRSSSVVTFAWSPTSSCLKITDRSFRGMLHRVSGISCLYLSVSPILVPSVPLFPTHLFLHLSLLPLLIHHFAYPWLPLSFTPGLTGLPPRTFACTVSSELIGFSFLVFP